jgi:hypothetical protein
VSLTPALAGPSFVLQLHSDHPGGGRDESSLPASVRCYGFSSCTLRWCTLLGMNDGGVGGHQAWLSRRGMDGAVDPASLAGAPVALSLERWATYGCQAGGEYGAGARLYTWNVEVSGAFWGPIHLLEVTLRNAISARLSFLAGAECWWEGVRLYHPQSFQLASARRRVVAAGRECSAGRVIAELGLGFWVGLLSNRYHAALWVPSLAAAFPYRPEVVRRGDIHADLESLRLLRNRIAHHEPIFGRDLERDHDAILQILSYVDRDVLAWVRSHSRVEICLARKNGCLSGKLPTSF